MTRFGPAARLLRKRSLAPVAVVVMAMAGLLVAVAPRAQASPPPPFAKGDVFVSVGNASVQYRHPNGALVSTLTDNTTINGATAGSAFDSSGNLYVTDFCNGPVPPICDGGGSVPNVSKFSHNDGHLLGTFGSAAGYKNPESIVFDASGKAYVGDVEGGTPGGLLQFTSSGVLQQQFPGTGPAGTGRVDWIDLASDQCTMFYTNENSPTGTNNTTGIHRYNVCTKTPMSDFTTLTGTTLHGVGVYTVRILCDGSVLVADQTQIDHISANGNVILRTYAKQLPPLAQWYGLALDPDGKSFWAAQSITGDVVKFDIATGNVVSQFNDGVVSRTGGLSVFGAPTAATSCVTTSLHGGGHAGSAISVPAGTPVTDSATLPATVGTSTTGNITTGNITYTVYSDANCQTSIAKSTKVVAAGKAPPASAPVTLNTSGTYYWQASYLSPALKTPVTSPCGGEIQRVRFGLDHFLCYTATSNGPTVPVGLVNQFSLTGFTPTIGAVDLHCNPTQKTATTGNAPITNPNAHLLCWNITAPAQPAHTVTVTNQFGTATLTTGPPSQLCLPSWKSLTGLPNKTPVAPPGLSHFTCYPVAYAPGSALFKPPPSVLLKDQFSSTSVSASVKAPALLCLPTTTTLNGVTIYPMQNPTKHLLCFNVSATPTKNPVYDQNDFLDAKVNILKTQLLCLPSTKKVVPPPPAPTKTTSQPGSLSIVLGTSNSDTATVTSSVPFSTTSLFGTVSFYLCGPYTAPPTTSPACQSTNANAVSLGGSNSNGNGGLSFGFGAAGITPTAAGWWCFASYYAGNATHAPSSDTSTDECFKVVANAVTAITTGDHSCALVTGGTVKCWGYNGAGQLGDGTNTGPLCVSGAVCSATPVDVTGLSGTVTAVAASAFHTCALIAGGAVQCWGQTPGLASTTPVNVSGLSGAVTAVAAGFSHTCALITGGTVQCWGENALGELGDGTANNSPTPVNVTGLNGPATAIGAGADFSCALIKGGTVQCWGENNLGELGNPVSQTCPNGLKCDKVAVSVIGLNGIVTKIAVGTNSACALITGGTVQCWGENNGTSSPTPVNVTGFSGTVTGIAAGNDHWCALITGGTVQCWGDDVFGQLGNNSTPGLNSNHFPTPVNVTGLNGTVTAISAGLNNSCALITGGTVQCWGWNAEGELGDGESSGPQICISGVECSMKPVNVIGL